MVFEKVQELIGSQLGIPEADITMESCLAADLGADSLDVVELLMAVEEEFGVAIPDEEVEKMTTVEDVVTYIEGKVS